MDGSTELDVGANRSGGRTRQVAQRAASGLESWVYEVGQAPPVVANAAIYTVKRSWTTKGAFLVGTLVFLCGVPVAFGVLSRFAGGLFTAADARPLHKNASIEAQIGRGIGRPTVLAVGGFSKGVGDALKEYKGVEAYYAEEDSPSRVSGVSYRRPEGMK